MKKIYTLFLFSLLFLGLSNTVSAQTIIMTEDFSSLSAGGNTSGSGANGPSSTELKTEVTPNFASGVKAYAAGGAIKLGSSSAIGSITSIPLDLSVNGGEFKVKVKVKGWSSVEGKLKITVGSSSQELTYTAKMADAFEEVEAEFTGGTTNSTIKIETTAKRAFIDEVTVYYGGSTQSNDATLSAVDIDGTPLSSFDPATVTYYVTLNTNTVPVLAPTLNDTNASFTTTNATSVPGKSEIKVTAENGTTERIYAFYWSYQPAAGEKGSKSNPYTVAEAQANQLPIGTTTKYWVKGYIVGGMKSSGAEGSGTTVASNVVLADTKTADITDNSLLLPVELLTGSTTRTALNLVDNPQNYNAEILVYGTLETYFSIGGVKNTSDYQILTTVGITEVAADGVDVYAKDGNIVVKANEAQQIEVYTTSGKLVTTQITTELSFPADKGVYLVKVGSKTVKIIL